MVIMNPAELLVMLLMTGLMVHCFHIGNRIISTIYGISLIGCVLANYHSVFGGL